MIINCLKVIIFLLILFIKIIGHFLFDDKKTFNWKYSAILRTLNYNSVKKKLRIAVYTLTISGGGRARMTALLINYLHKIKIINIIPYENDYLFKRWGIRSFYLDNFVTYDYDCVVPSDLSEKIILMVGSANRKNKRFNLGIEAMKFILKEVPDSQLNIISKSKPKKLKELIHSLNLEENVKFAPFTLSPALYFKNASLHIFPTNYESFGLVLCETKIYGIPNILLGLNYVSISKGGTIIIYDDKPESLANEAIKILKNKRYRKKLGKEARKSMKKFNNNILLLKWVKLILSVFKGDKYFELLRKNSQKISDDEAINIINSQVKFLQMRLPNLRNITFNKFINLI